MRNIFIAMWLMIPLACHLTPAQQANEIDLVRADLTSLATELDPVADAGPLATLADIDKGLGVLADALRLYEGGGEVKTVLDALDLLVKMSTALYDQHGDPNDPKHRDVRLAMKGVEILVRHVRAGLEPANGEA